MGQEESATSCHFGTGQYQGNVLRWSVTQWSLSTWDDQGVCLLQAELLWSQVTAPTSTGWGSTALVFCDGQACSASQASGQASILVET